MLLKALKNCPKSNLVTPPLSLKPGGDDTFWNFSPKLKKSGGSIFSDARIAVFGNSETSKPGDWLQPIVSNNPPPAASTSTSTSRVSSKVDDGVCRNVVTSLHVEVVFANAGSFNNPQVTCQSLRAGALV